LFLFLAIFFTILCCPLSFCAFWRFSSATVVSAAYVFPNFVTSLDFLSFSGTTHSFSKHCSLLHCCDVLLVSVFSYALRTMRFVPSVLVLNGLCVCCISRSITTLPVLRQWQPVHQELPTITARTTRMLGLVTQQPVITPECTI